MTVKNKNNKIAGIIAAVIIAAVLIGGYIIGFFLLNGNDAENKVSEVTEASAKATAVPLPSMSAEQITQQENAAIKEIDDKININTATKSELMLLDGIGETLSSRIVATRESLGGFKTVEDIKKVEGIGDKLYESIKDYIYVGSE